MGRRRVTFGFFLALMLPAIAYSGWEPLGLEGYVVRSMASNGLYLFATTRQGSETAAVWRYALQSPDAEWERAFDHLRIARTRGSSRL